MRINRFSDIYKSFDKINEGAWGHMPLDNDAASDWKWVFGKMIYNEILDKLKKSIENDDLTHMYYCIGMWEYFRDKHKHKDDSYGIFIDEQIQELDYLSIKTAEQLIERYEEMGWKNPEEVKTYLEKLLSKLI